MTTKITGKRSLAVAAAITMALTFTGCGSTKTTGDTETKSDSTPSASPTPSESPSESPTAAQGATAFGPTGVDGITIGMKLDELKATGKAAFPDGDGFGACAGFDYAALPKPSSAPGEQSYDGMVGPTKGVELIVARPEMKTPEGIGIGSTKAEMLKAYPNAKFQPDYGTWMVHLPGQPEGTSYNIGIKGGQVNLVNLGTQTPECYN